MFGQLVRAMLVKIFPLLLALENGQKRGKRRDAKVERKRCINRYARFEARGYSWMSFSVQYFICGTVYTSMTYFVSSFYRSNLLDVTQIMHNPIYFCNVILETKRVIVNSFLRLFATLYLVSNLNHETL